MIFMRHFFIFLISSAFLEIRELSIRRVLKTPVFTSL